jgi:hypothetical protein
MYPTRTVKTSTILKVARVAVEGKPLFSEALEAESESDV